MFSANSSQVSNDANYIEDVFSTYLYTGNGSTQTITNGIDLAGKGGMVWIKNRTHTGTWHDLQDTERGPKYSIFSNSTSSAVFQDVYGVQSFNSNGFSVGSGADFNENNYLITSWTFRKQPKFFDVVTYTGDGTNDRPIAHNLKSTPGCIIIKKTSGSGGVNWGVWHRSIPQDGGATDGLLLDQTGGIAEYFMVNGLDQSTSTNFVVSGASSGNNSSGGTYVAYLFAHNAGGFGLTGTDNVISCGSYTDGAGVSVNLGYEPQWLLVKAASSSSGWVLMDTMRGMNTTDDRYLQAQLSDAEGNFGSSYWHPTATGFYMPSAAVSAGTTMIYIAIRRGPMKVPTSGTSVFNAVAPSAGSTSIPSIVPDAVFNQTRTGSTDWQIVDRLRGFLNKYSSWGLDATANNPFLSSNRTNSETTGGCRIGLPPDTVIPYFDNNLMPVVAPLSGSVTQVSYFFKRAPSFFDEVCYTGDGTSSRVINHNLGVGPELIISKPRSAIRDWNTQVPALLGYSSNLVLNRTDANAGNGISYLFASGNATTLTLSSINTGYSNNTGTTYVVYLFATCAGVSKVGSYTGTGATQTINCGFTGGARFVLIKATDSTGDWYVWDSARGIVPSNDPYLTLNTFNLEVTNTDWVDTAASGFELSNSAGNLANSNGVSYIFLAIA